MRRRMRSASRSAASVPRGDLRAEFKDAPPDFIRGFVCRNDSVVTDSTLSGRFRAGGDLALAF